MELFCRCYTILFFNFLILEKNIILYQIKLPSTHLSVRRLQFWLVVNALPPSLPFHYFSATQWNFLPFKLEPLGFSLTGQLRVAPQFNLYNITYRKKYVSLFGCFNLLSVNYVDNFYFQFFQSNHRLKLFRQYYLLNI